MIIRCKKTRQYVKINKEQLYYLQRLLGQVDIENTLENLFDEETIERSECIDIAILIDREITSNTIFEYTTNRKIEPIIKTKNLTISNDNKLQPLSISNLQFLSKVTELLSTCNGVYIEK